MENQHRKIKGYRELNQDEISLMNEVKDMAEEVRKLIDDLHVVHSQTGGHCVDQRWVAIGKTNLQQGFMALTRAIAQPDSF